MRPRSPLVLLGTIAGIGLLVTGCASENAADGDAGAAAETAEAHIVVTTSILGDVVTSIVGDGAEVEVLMGAGTDPHSFEASAAQARLLREADLVVANGLGLEAQLESVLGAAEDEGGRVLLLGEHVDPLRWDAVAVDDHGSGEEHPEQDDGHGDDDHAGEDDEQGPHDPHVWFDPVRMAEGVRVLGQELAAIGGEHSEEWAAAAEAYADDLLDLHRELETVLAAVPDGHRKLVTNHHALGYLADRYGFEVVGTVIPDIATLAEPGARQLRDLAELIEREDIPAIFAETSAPTRLAEAIAEEADREVEVVVLHTGSLGPEGSGAETYPEMLRTTARRIAAALGE